MRSAAELRREVAELEVQRKRATSRTARDILTVRIETLNWTLGESSIFDKDGAR